MKRIMLLVILIISLTSIKNVKAIEGIDVSEYQGYIDFNLVKEDGIEIVYIRSSEGFSYVDSNFIENYQNAKANNLKVGFYHYVTATNVEEAKIQAEFFASLVKDKEIDCRLAMDFENLNNLTNNEIEDIAQTFLDTLKTITGKDVTIYTGAYNAYERFNQDFFLNYPLWVAEYEVTKPEVNNYIGWQYTSSGKINGINTFVDRDIFKEEIYLNQEEPEVPIEESIIYYKIKEGDTLIKIASLYQVTVLDIINENNIKNPNLIYPNNTLKITTKYPDTINNGKYNIHLVKKQETLTYISNIYNVSIYELIKINNIKNPNIIYNGEYLLIKN